MKMKTGLIILLALFGSVTSIVAGNKRDCLLVHFASGGSVAFPLSGEPMITFDGGVVTIATGRYQISDVRKYTFGDYATGIDDVNSDGTGLGGYSPDGRFFCIQLKYPDVPVKLYTVGGVEVMSGLKADADGMIRVDMSSLGQDVYLLTVGNETIKIRRQ